MATTAVRPRLTVKHRLETTLERFDQFEFDLEIEFDRMSEREEGCFYDSDRFTPPLPLPFDNPKLELSVSLYRSGSHLHYMYLKNTAIAGTGLTGVQFFVKSRVSMLDQQAGKLFTSDRTNSFYLGSNSSNTIFSNATVNQHFVDDRATFLCEFTIVWPKEVNQAIKTTQNSTTKLDHQQRLCTGMQKLFDAQKLTDVTLVVGAQEFQAHKTVLSAQSSVFEAMFTHGQMKEQQTGRVQIDIDLDPAVMGHFLRFLYTGELPDLTTVDSMAEDLLVLADRYQVESLRTICDRELCTRLAPNTVHRLVALADRHNANQLKVEGMRYFRRNTQEVIGALFDNNQTDQLLRVFRELSVTVSGEQE